MKKLFNRTKKSVQEWEGYTDDNYDWDEAEQGTDAEGYYEEEDVYYTEEGASEDETYYEDEGYYEDETITDAEGNDEPYYAETEYVKNDSEIYEAYDAGDGVEYSGAEENFSQEALEEEEYYYEEASMEGEYAESGEYAEFGEYAESGVYAEDRGNDLDYIEPEENKTRVAPTRRPVGRPTRKKAGFMGKAVRMFTRMGVIDRLILGTGVAVLILAVVTGGVYISSRIRINQVSSFVSVGSQLNDIDMIGEAGLLAVADAQQAKQAAADLVDDSQSTQDGEQDEEQNKDYDEEEYRRQVQVVMEFVSIQKDLKIKFVNDKTKKLVANVPFSVTVKNPDGKSFIWSDDDMDGIIYKKDITPGSYTVTMEALTDNKYANYSVSTLSRTVDVKKNIAYEKVEVANEIKSESEVNASKEDTKKNETQVESSLQDTVAWVESSVLEAAYDEVAKSSIPDPMTLALSQSFTRASNTVTGGDGSTLSKGTVTIQPDKVTVAQDGEIYPQASVSGFTGGKALKYAISASNKYAAASIDDTGKITIKGLTPGTTQFTVTVDYKDKGTDKSETAGTAFLTVTVTPPKTLTLDATTAIAYIGEPLIINATVTGTIDFTVKAVSQDESVAAVTVNKSAVTINGKKAGVSNITVSLMENGTEIAKSVCVVTVKDNPKTDKISLLKDSVGNQLFVLENGEYREAVFSDYYVEANKFYLRTAERYTGWQTIDGKVYYFTAQGEKVIGEQVIQGAKYQFASDGSLVTGTGALGIDVSKWNGNIDWNAVKKSGINYVIIRCGYRGSAAGSLIVDPKFTANIKGATAVGLKVGVYFFTQAIDEREAVEEASMVLELVKNYTISYPIFLDVESSGGRADAIDKATRTAVCKAFCQTIQNAHYTAGIYANKTWLDNKLDAGALSAYKIWLAQYAEKPTYTGRYDMWQYRSTGSVGGISGDVDMNLSYLGY